MLATHAKITKDDLVLDAGCGVGGSSIWLAKNIGCKVVGISLSDNQVKHAISFAKKENITGLVTFAKKDFTATGFDDASFDVVWGLESVCHAPDKKLFINEAKRILKKDGRIVVADFFKKDKLAGTEAALIKRWAHGWAIDDFATVESFSQQLEEAGFINITCKDASSNILPSAKRLYRSYFIGVIAALIYRLFNRKATTLGKNNVDTAMLQYKTLKKDLWKYAIFSAEKN